MIHKETLTSLKKEADMNEQPPEQPYRSSPSEYSQYQPYSPYSPPPPYVPPQPQYVPPPYYSAQLYYAPQPYYPPEPGSTAALLGFIFSLVGTFVFPFCLIAGLILSINGLRSRSRHGLAVAGLVISIIMIAIWFIIIVGIIISVSASSPPY